MKVAVLLGFMCVALTSKTAAAYNVSCAIGLSNCVVVQGQKIPQEKAVQIVNHCRDFTRNNIGARYVQLSTAEIIKIAGKNALHPLYLAMFAYDQLHDSELKFDRSLPFEKRYIPVRRACGELFRDMKITWPTDE